MSVSRLIKHKHGIINLEDMKQTLTLGKQMIYIYAVSLNSPAFGGHLTTMRILLHYYPGSNARVKTCSRKNNCH